jgi:hypothetical protein
MNAPTDYLPPLNLRLYVNLHSLLTEEGVGGGKDISSIKYSELGKINYG